MPEQTPPCVLAGRHGPYTDDGRCRGCGAQIRVPKAVTERPRRHGREYDGDPAKGGKPVDP